MLDRAVRLRTVDELMMDAGYGVMLCSCVFPPSAGPD